MASWTLIQFEIIFFSPFLTGMQCYSVTTQISILRTIIEQSDETISQFDWFYKSIWQCCLHCGTLWKIAHSYSIPVCFIDLSTFKMNRAAASAPTKNSSALTQEWSVCCRHCSFLSLFLYGMNPCPQRPWPTATRWWAICRYRFCGKYHVARI